MHVTSTPRAPPCGARAAPNEPPSSLPLSLFSSFHFFDHAHLRWFPNRECDVLCDSARLEMGVTTRVSRVLGVSGGVFRVFEC